MTESRFAVVAATVDIIVVVVVVSSSPLLPSSCSSRFSTRLLICRPVLSPATRRGSRLVVVRRSEGERERERERERKKEREREIQTDREQHQTLFVVAIVTIVAVTVVILRWCFWCLVFLLVRFYGVCALLLLYSSACALAGSDAGGSTYPEPYDAQWLTVHYRMLHGDAPRAAVLIVVVMRANTIAAR